MALTRPRNGPQGNNLTPEVFYFHRHDPGKGPIGSGVGEIKKGKINNDEWKLQFEAHITDISDSSSPSWNETFDMGRADPKVFYGGMNRSVNVNFFVVAVNEDEHYHNHEVLLARLGRLTYPLYQTGVGYNAPHVYYQIGRLMKGFGIITSLNYSWDSETPWLENRPLITNVALTIRVLADPTGKRPDVDKSWYFI